MILKLRKVNQERLEMSNKMNYIKELVYKKFLEFS